MRRARAMRWCVRVVAAVLLLAGTTVMTQGTAVAGAYDSLVTGDGATSYWRLDESSGTKAADSVGTNPGTVLGGVTLGVPGALSQGGTAARLDGSTGYVSVPNNASLNITGDLTVEAWARPDVLNGVGGAVLQKGGSSGYSVWQYRLSITSANKWRGTVFVGASAFSVTATATPSLTDWTHLAMVRSGSSLTLYVNGAVAGTTTVSGATNTSTGILAIGRSGGSASDYFRGSVDEAAVYPRALSAAQVQAHRDTGTTAPPVAPVAGFTATPTSGEAPLDVAFTDTSTGAPTSWSWDFGDGATSTQQSPGHRYAEPGDYTVRLDVANSAGAATVTRTDLVHVTAPTPQDPVLVGAGDIATCGSDADEQTATVLDGVQGTVFALGDNAYDSGSASEYSDCYGPTWGRHKGRTLFPVAGNHDYNTAGATGYYGYFGDAAGDPAKGWYSRDVGGWHVVVLNSNCTVVGCGLDSPQEQWLRADLAASTAPCTVALWHHPRASSGIYANDPSVQAFWEDLYYAGADLVLNGHEHIYERFRPLDAAGTADDTYGITQFIVGTGGAELRSLGTLNPASVARNAATYGVLKLTLHPDSGDFAFLPVAGGSYTDNGSVACHGAPPPPPAPTADFSATPSSGTAPMTAAFTDQSTAATSWKWDFGDGTTSTLQNPTHSYSLAGTYDVTLTVRNYTGTDTRTRTGYIDVDAPPQTGSYLDTVLSDSPVGYWRLGESSGTTAADRTGGPAGTYVGGVTLGAPGALASDSDTAVKLNGSTGYVRVDNRADLNFSSGDFTTEAWVRPDVSAGMAILQKGGSSGYSVWQYRLSLTSAGRWRGTVFVGTSNITVTDPSAPNLSAWTHLVMVRQGTLLKLYVNGLEVARTTFTGDVNTSTGMLAVGRAGNSSSDYYRGAVDEVAVYPRALSESSVFAHYTAGRG